VAEIAGSNVVRTVDAMVGQLSLVGFDPAPRPTDRLFFAIVPDATSAARLAQLARRENREHGINGRLVAANRFHISLHFLGLHAGVPQRLVAAARDAATAITMPPFRVTLDRAVTFSGQPGNRPLVVRGDDGVTGVRELQRTLLAAMRRVGLEPAVKSSFAPHLTVLYIDRIIAEHPVEAVSWVVRELVLIRSRLGLGRHERLARWPLLG
jgi:RNA 2',3'-cyclic 3'-phosphodiesterase